MSPKKHNLTSRVRRPEPTVPVRQCEPTELERVAHDKQTDEVRLFELERAALEARKKAAEVQQDEPTVPAQRYEPNEFERAALDKQAQRRRTAHLDRA